ncbi:hypothetical protein [Gilliamella sp. Gris1-4]|uniref:hypothetical protein n=1 Tax=Gilliamella sp. Gris1-4 TaxID=3120244 RepID=UPI00080DA077|nr:hypothetical protein [Gilliamella apicola]OCG37828.1 hypothetical protein A9G31_00330 [Gilliamella apicola]OCG66877.1 hypothetical protein A9G39_00405 [Gilliamella apicola]
MKILQLIIFVIFNSVLISCDYAKKASQDTSTANWENDDLSDSQNSVIDSIKKELPIDIDELTTLVDISKDHNTINYRYNVKNTPEQALLLPTTIDTIRQKLLNAYCEDNKEMNELKKDFPDGINYHYDIDNKEIIIIELKSIDCKEK